MCGREMPARKLDRHMAAHDVSRTFACQECSFNAFDVLQLKQHYRKRHKLSTPSIINLMQKLRQAPSVRTAKARRANGGSGAGGKLFRAERLSLPDMRRESLEVVDDDSQMSVEPKDVSEEEEEEEEQEEEEVKQEVRMTRTRALGSTGGSTPTRHQRHSPAASPNKEDEEAAAATSRLPDRPLRERRQRTAANSVDNVAFPAAAVSEPTANGANDDNKAVDRLLARMPSLMAAERVMPKERGYHPAQRAWLAQLFELTWHPTTAQKQIMQDKLGVPMSNIRYFFDNNRRRVLRLQEQATNKATTHARLKPRKAVLREKGAVVGVLTYRECDLRRSRVSLDEHIESGEPICIGVNLNPEERRCLLCDFKCGPRLKFAAHLRSHRFEPRFCGSYRDNGDLQSTQRGCRKHFSEDTFDEHFCSSRPPVFFKAPVNQRTSSRAPMESDHDTSKATLLARIKLLSTRGGGVCIAYEQEGGTFCTMCNYGGAARGNMFRHIIHHGLPGYKFCRECRKIFLPTTFNGHICDTSMPASIGYFPLNKGAPKRLASPLNNGSDEEEEECDEDTEDDDSDSDEDDDEEDEEEDGGPDEESIARTMAAEDKPVCVGYEVSESMSQCTFCNYSCSFRGNLCKHIRSHGFIDVAFCKMPRENSELPSQAMRGCRKIFTVDTFDLHVCTTETPDQLGEFKISRGHQGYQQQHQRQKSKKKKRSRRRGSFGTPAKFYCDNDYSRLFQRLASRDKHAFPMDTTFMRNGQLELTSYLTANQMKAVREFCWGSDKYFLVGQKRWSDIIDIHARIIIYYIERVIHF